MRNRRAIAIQSLVYLVFLVLLTACPKPGGGCGRCRANGGGPRPLGGRVQPIGPNGVHGPGGIGNNGVNGLVNNQNGGDLFDNVNGLQIPQQNGLVNVPAL